MHSNLTSKTLCTGAARQRTGHNGQKAPATMGTRAPAPGATAPAPCVAVVIAIAEAAGGPGRVQSRAYPRRERWLPPWRRPAEGPPFAPRTLHAAPPSFRQFACEGAVGRAHRELSGRRLGALRAPAHLDQLLALVVHVLLDSYCVFAQRVPRVSAHCICQHHSAPHARLPEERLRWDRIGNSNVLDRSDFTYLLCAADRSGTVRRSLNRLARSMEMERSRRQSRSRSRSRDRRRSPSGSASDSSSASRSSAASRSSRHDRRRSGSRGRDESPRRDAPAGGAIEGQPKRVFTRADIERLKAEKLRKKKEERRRSKEVRRRRPRAVESSAAPPR